LAGMRFGWRTRFVVLGAGLAVALGGIAWRATSGPRVPVHEGRPISRLLEESSYLPQGRFRLYNAVRELKGEAVPYLVHVLKNKPTMPQRVYERLFFGVPQVLRQRLPRPSFYENRRGTCAALLGFTGSDGAAQIPFLVRISREDANRMVRLNARSALVRLGPGSEYETVALEALIAGMRDSEVTWNEYGWLGAFTNRAAEVVPILLKGLENPNAREECIEGLKRLGAAAEPLIQAAIARGEVSILQLDMGLTWKGETTNAEESKLKELF
jgi:hypothetical protein